MAKKYAYRTTGTCSRAIILTVEDEILCEVQYIGGCSGNTQGVARLAAGLPLDEVREKLAGIRCGEKPTSCPDQLARAIALLKAGEFGGDLVEL